MTAELRRRKSLLEGCWSCSCSFHLVSPARVLAWRRILRAVPEDDFYGWFAVPLICWEQPSFARSPPPPF